MAKEVKLGLLIKPEMKMLHSPSEEYQFTNE